MLEDSENWCLLCKLGRRVTTVVTMRAQRQDRIVPRLGQFLANDSGKIATFGPHLPQV